MCVLVEFEHSVPRVHSGRHFCPVVVILINPGPGDIKHSVCVLFRKSCLKKKQVDSGVFLPLHYPLVFLCLALFVFHSLSVSVSTVYLVFKILYFFFSVFLPLM